MNTEEIKGLTYTVNNLLTLYIEVHDGIFAQSWWRSIPVPGLFKAVDFNQHELQISRVGKMLEEIKNRVSAISANATLTEREYLGSFYHFISSLLNAVTALEVIVAGLKRKADGKEYDFTVYNKDIASYKNFEKEYHSLGKDMNEKWSAYQKAID